MRRALAVMAAGCLLLAAAAASAETDAGHLVQKLGGRILLLEEGIRVHVNDGTRITKDGEVISYGEIPTPEESAPAPVRIEWTGSLSGGMVQASKVEVERVLR